MKLKLVLLLFISLFVISCGENDPEPYNPSTEIWPLAEGNSWTYHAYRYHSTYPDEHWSDDTLTIYVSKKVNIQGEDWFVIAVDGRSLLIAKNKKDGFWAHLFVNFTEVRKDSVYLHYKYPAKVGDKSTIYLGEFLTLSLNNDVNTPAGKFNCIRYINNADPLAPMYDDYMSPGFGMVFSKQIEEINKYNQVLDTLWYNMELISYKINVK